LKALKSTGLQEVVNPIGSKKITDYSGSMEA
jgi:hypothetical protein